MKSIAFIISFFLIVASCYAQSVVGFWKVTSVKVGDQTMTPVAKWYKNNNDGTFQSGNGWTQNSVGTWTFDEKTQKFIPTNTNGIKDEFGPFTVSFIEGTMTLEREEEGVKVTVSLVRIKKLPIAPADQVNGLWILTKVENKVAYIVKDFDPNQRQYIHIRPDRRYRLRHPDERITQGFWHMDGHRPKFTLIDYDRKIENLVYSVSFDQNQLIMKAQNEQGLLFYYSRIDEFPH